MVVGQKQMARRRMEVAEKAHSENLAAVLSIAEDFLRHKASRHDLISAVVTARVSHLAASAAASTHERIASEAPDHEEGEESYV